MARSRLFRGVVLMQTLLALVVTPCHSNAVILTWTFGIETTRDTYLELYLTGRDIRSQIECALKCGNRRSDSEACMAFDYHPLDKTCDFYKIGQSLVTASDLRIYQLNLRDIFHKVYIGDRIYSVLLSSAETTYFDARTHCNDLGGYLYEFESLEEFDAVKLVTAGQPENKAFVGINDLDKEDEWVTDRDGSPMNTTIWRWDPPQPNNYEGVEDCGSIGYMSMLLLDLPCTYPRHFLCKRNTTKI